MAFNKFTRAFDFLLRKTLIITALRIAASYKTNGVVPQSFIKGRGRATFAIHWNERRSFGVSAAAVPMSPLSNGESASRESFELPTPTQRNILYNPVSSSKVQSFALSPAL